MRLRISQSNAAIAGLFPMTAFVRLLQNCLDPVTEHGTFVRTMPSIMGVCRSLVSLLLYYEWKLYTPIIQNTSFLIEAANHLRKLAESKDIKVNEPVSVSPTRLPFCPMMRTWCLMCCFVTGTPGRRTWAETWRKDLGRSSKKQFTVHAVKSLALMYIFWCILSS